MTTTERASSPQAYIVFNFRVIAVYISDICMLNQMSLQGVECSGYIGGMGTWYAVKKVTDVNCITFINRRILTGFILSINTLRDVG